MDGRMQALETVAEENIRRNALEGGGMREKMGIFPRGREHRKIYLAHDKRSFLFRCRFLPSALNMHMNGRMSGAIVELSLLRGQRTANMKE